MDETDQLLASAGMYSLLGRMWRREIDDLFFQQLLVEPFSSEFQLTRPASEEETRRELDRLASEYCRLFVGPRGHFPPIQSVWHEGRLDTEVTASVRAFAEAVNYEAEQDCPRGFWDHLGVELSLMGHICSMLHAAETQSPMWVNLSGMRETFFRVHLTWTDNLISGALAKAESEGLDGLYPRLLVNTRSFLKVEAER